MDALSSSWVITAKAAPMRTRRRRRPISAVLTNEPSRTEIATQKKPGTPSPPPSPSPSLASSLTNAIHAIIKNFIDPAAHRPSVEPCRVLADNFAPVPELPPTHCRLVSGEIPSCLLGGAYIRNGPNPQHLPRGTHHLFDGDGMLHSLLLPAANSSPAVLSSRFVHTYKYLLEREAGRSVLPNAFSGCQGVAGLARGAVILAHVVTGQMNPAACAGLANTSLAFFGGRLFALGESDLPYAVHLSPSSGDTAPVGRWDFAGKLAAGMTAHPKKDPLTGEVFAFRYAPLPPFLTYFRFDREGNRAGPEVHVFSLPRPPFLHDFAITERYAVFCDMQIVMQPMQMVLGGSPVGADAGKVPRIGVLPKYAASEAEMRWFEAPEFNPVHAINAWEEDDELVLVAPNVLSVEHALDRIELAHSLVEMVRINLQTGLVSRIPLSPGNLDFGVINPRYQGRRSRFVYLGVGDPPPKVSGVVKLDMDRMGGDCVVAAHTYGRRRYGGEPLFVAAPEEGDGEDDGYMVTYLHDEDTKESSFLVMDARSPELEVVAEIALPARVPYGFHGIFLSATEIRSQRGGRSAD